MCVWVCFICCDSPKEQVKCLLFLSPFPFRGHKQTNHHKSENPMKVEHTFCLHVDLALCFGRQMPFLQTSVFIWVWDQHNKVLVCVCPLAKLKSK